MKIAYNPKTAAVITAATAVNDDILFDLNARKVWAKGLRMGADWADISSKPSSLKNPAAIKFRDINGTEVSYDGSVAKDLTTGTYTARLPYGFSSFDSKPTWGNTTGTTIACWKEASGGSIDFRKDNPSSGKMSIKVDGRVYVNEGTNPVLSAEHNNNYWGMRTPDGGNDWIRTPNSGLLPYINGNAGSGHSSLGTNSWYFSTAYIDKVYGSLKGNADTATTATTALKADKLTNARNIALGTDLRGSANFDGSGNITISATINSCSVSISSTDTLHFKRIAHLETAKSYNDNALLLYISQGYINGNNGICRIEFRTDNIATSSTSITASAAVRWLVRNGYNLGSLYAGYYVTANKAYIDIYLKTTGSYQGTTIRVLQDSRGSINSSVQLINAHYYSDTDYKEAYSSIEAAATSLYNKAYTKIVSGSDAGIVAYSNSTGSVHWNNVTNKPGSFTPSSHTHTWASITDKLVAGNEFNIVNAGFNAEIYINYLPINDRNKTASIPNYIMGNGAKGMASVTASGFKKQGSNDNYVLLGGGSHAAISSLSVKYATNAGSAGSAGSANKLNKWFNFRIADLNQQFGDGALRIFNATSSTTDNKCPTDASILHLAWDDNGGYDTQLALATGGNNMYFRGQAHATWNPWRTVLHDGNSSISGSTITINGSSLKLNIANWDTAYTFVSTITGTDTDNVINKWEEIVNFLSGITEDNKLNTLLSSKLSIQQLTNTDILTTKTNNALFWVDTIGNASAITTGPFTDHPYALLSVTNYSQNDTNSKFFYRSRLAFSSAGDIKVASCHHQNEYKQDDAWYNVLTSKNSGISGSTIKLNGTSITVYSSGTADGRYVKKSGDSMTGALNFANNIWNKVGDDSYIGDCNREGHFGIKALSATYPGIAFFNNSGVHLGNLTAYSGNIKYGAYSLQFLDNGNTSVVGSTWTNPFSAYNKDAVKDGQAICVWGQSSSLGNLSSDGGNIALYLRRISASAATLNMILDGEYYANGNQRLAHVSEIPSSLKNPHALTLKANGTTLATYDGSSVKEANFTYANVGAAPSQHTHDYLVINAADDTSFNSAYSNFQVLYAGGSNGITGKPAGVDAFGLFRFRVAGGWSGQMLFAHNGSLYIRSAADVNINNKLAWRQIIDSTTIGQQSVKYATSAGSATSATKVIVNQHTANDFDYPLVWSNQSSTSNATENQLFKSWQDLYYNPKNKRLFVGGAVSTAYINATNTVTSAGFKHSGVTKNADQYVLTAGGGYTFLNQASNELAHEFNVSIAVTSEWQDIAGFHGGSQTFLTQPGTYIVQVYYESNPADGMYQGYFSGIMSWYTRTTNSNNADEIVLHRVGHAYANTIYLRTRESLKGDPDPYTKLQISANSNLKEHTYKFKFKRIC